MKNLLWVRGFKSTHKIVSIVRLVILRHQDKILLGKYPKEMCIRDRADTISNPGTDLIGNQPGMTLDDNSLSGSSLSSSQEIKTSKSRKDFGAPKKDNPLLEISKLIPVTGERPKPDNRDSPLDDDVLHAVFLILWEMDPNQQGMTVKQLCDLLLQKHPDMSNLSTKLSNLISAKLNAYVKKIEKGEKTLIYALSREWSNSSPRRLSLIHI